MRCFLFCVLGGVFLWGGCSGPERKLGRGLSNVAEVVRVGELRRSMEQRGLWGSPEEGLSRGLVSGVVGSVKRTAVGVYEVATFAFPSYEPVLLPEWGVFPDNYEPSLLSDSIYATDGALGFSGGDVAPELSWSRFKVFDY